MSHLSKEDLRFLQENTKFNKDEIKQWYKGFMVSMYMCTYRYVAVHRAVCTFVIMHVYVSWYVYKE